jgi:glycosyltransferase involved in cell wall biosynthesis
MDNPMRILMLTQLYPPVFGGIERHVRDLGQELVARGHSVSVVTLQQKDTEPFELDGDVRVHRVRGTVHRFSSLLFRNPDRRYAPPFPDPGLTAEIRRIVAEEKPDIVHAHNWMVHSYLPLAQRGGPPLVVTLHDHGLRCPKWVLMYEGSPCSGPALLKCMRCTADYYGRIKSVVTVLASRRYGAVERRETALFLPASQAVVEGNALAEAHVPYQIIPNFLSDCDPAPPEDNEALEPYLSQLPDREYILYVGAYGRFKGFHVLLEAYNRLVQAQGQESVPPLVLIGYETGEFPLESTPLPPGASVLRHWPHDAVMEAWRRCMLGVVPSIWPDPCPTVAMEAMAMAKPVIASRIGGLVDILADGETGLLVTPDDPAALCDALADMVADPERRERMGEAGHRRLALFCADSVVPRYEQAYRDVLGGHSRAASASRQTPSA